ncbi:MAG: epoxyqueuosine reductase QueH [Clostridiales bacterium]|nr:epoxyqueuosine reductase QueH [Clostridiales bacterium]
MNNINYQRKMEDVINRLGDRKPRLLLQCCCAPCASAVLERLAPHFTLGLYFYNPNIAPYEEYLIRKEELCRLVGEMGIEAELIDALYDSDGFYAMAKGLEDAPEGGSRCMGCFDLRLSATAQAAKDWGAEYFCTTLSISPLKSAGAINAIGERIGQQVGVNWLPSDFKKKGGYQRSIELSRQYRLYRQNYCGCEFSRRAGVSIF